MTENLRVLLPKLPAELRFHIYGFLSIRDDTSIASSFGLPFQSKKYECKHTTTQICPVYYGSTGLVTLRKYHYREAYEYHAWLLNNAIELRIGVHFTGRVNTFVQAHWDTSMAVHLRKLGRQYTWLVKASKYDIQILWAPMDGVLQSKKKDRLTACIPRGILKTLTILKHESTKLRLKHVNVGLCLERSVALQNTLSTIKFGLATFLSPINWANEFETFTLSISSLPARKTEPKRPNTRFIELPSRQKVGGDLPDSIRKSVQTAYLIMSKTYTSDRVFDVVARDTASLGSDFVFHELARECLEHR